MKLEKIELIFNNDGNEINNYIDGWIYYSLFLKDINRAKLNSSVRINYLSVYLFYGKIKLILYSFYLFRVIHFFLNF